MLPSRTYPHTCQKGLSPFPVRPHMTAAYLHHHSSLQPPFFKINNKLLLDISKGPKDSLPIRILDFIHQLTHKQQARDNFVFAAIFDIFAYVITCHKGLDNHFPL